MRGDTDWGLYSVSKDVGHSNSVGRKPGKIVRPMRGNCLACVFGHTLHSERCAPLNERQRYALVGLVFLGDPENNKKTCVEILRGSSQFLSPFHDTPSIAIERLEYPPE